MGKSCWQRFCLILLLLLSSIIINKRVLESLSFIQLLSEIQRFSELWRRYTGVYASAATTAEVCAKVRAAEKAKRNSTYCTYSTKLIHYRKLRVPEIGPRHYESGMYSMGWGDQMVANVFLTRHHSGEVGRLVRQSEGAVSKFLMTFCETGCKER